MSEPKLDKLVEAGVLKSYNYFDSGDYEVLVLEFPNGETVTIQSVANLEGMSQLLVD